MQQQPTTTTGRRRHTGRRHTLCVSAMTSTTRLLARACTHYDDSMITLPNIFFFCSFSGILFFSSSFRCSLFTVHFFRRRRWCFCCCCFVLSLCLSRFSRAQNIFFFLHKRFFAVECLLFMRCSQLFYCLVRSYLLFFARLIHKRRPLTRRWWWSSAVTATAPLSRHYCFVFFFVFSFSAFCALKQWTEKNVNH